MTPCNPPSARTAALPAEGPQAALRAGQDGHGLPVDPALRQAFERALARHDGGAQDDEAQPPNADIPAVQATPIFVAPAGREMTRAHLDPEALVFVSSQPVTPPTPVLASSSPAPEGPGALPMPAALGAALSALTMPASPEGVQHWQFSFSQAGSALSGVTLTAQPQAPWLVQVHLLAPSLSATQQRERSALEARLGELRQRLLGRGAPVDDVELQEPTDTRRQR